MVIVDERILEFLSEESHHQPVQIAESLSDFGEGMTYHRKYIGKRCRLLAEYGLVRNLGNGLYAITEDGCDYLEGELNVNDLEVSNPNPRSPTEAD